MNPDSNCRQSLHKNYLVIISFLLLSLSGLSQKSIADSLRKSLNTETTDTGRVRLMWKLADAMNKYNPDSALVLAQEALYLAKKINDKEGESRSLGILANTFYKIGNYTRSLELNIQKLKLEEKEKIQGILQVL